MSQPSFRKRYLVPAAVAIIGTVWLLSLAAAPAAQAAGPCANPGNRFVGADSSFTTANFGVRANIEYRNPDLCGAESSSPSASAAFAMLGPRLPSDQYAQAGYYQQGGGVTGAQTPNGIHMFAQASRKCFPDCSGFNTR